MSSLFNSISIFANLVDIAPTISSIADANSFILKNADFFSELYSKLKDYSAAPSSRSDDDDFVVIEPDVSEENCPHFHCDEDELSVYSPKSNQFSPNDSNSFLSSISDDQDPNPNHSAIIRDFLNAGK